MPNTVIYPLNLPGDEGTQGGDVNVSVEGEIFGAGEEFAGFVGLAERGDHGVRSAHVFAPGVFVDGGEGAAAGGAGGKSADAGVFHDQAFLGAETGALQGEEVDGGVGLLGFDHVACEDGVEADVTEEVPGDGLG